VDTLAVDGEVYRLLDATANDVDRTGEDGSCQDFFLCVPTGWSIAPRSDDIIATVIAQHQWGTHGLCVADGSCWYTAFQGTDAGTEDRAPGYIIEDSQSGDVMVDGCSEQILLIRNATTAPGSGTGDGYGTTGRRQLHTRKQVDVGASRARRLQQSVCEHRYWGFGITEANSNDWECYVGELALFANGESPSAANLANRLIPAWTGASVDVDNSIGVAFDGIDDTSSGGHRTAAPCTNHFITIDLGSGNEADVTGVHISQFQTDGNGFSQFQIHWSDDAATWTVAHSYVDGFASSIDSTWTCTLCGADEYVSSGACTTCAAGFTRPAGDDSSGADTSCDINYCAVDQHVSLNLCIACPPGMTRPAGDDESGADTYCVPVYCGVDEYVHTNNWTACDPGMTSPGGDDASRYDTYCDPVYCGVDEYVHTNNCTACDPGRTSPGGDDASSYDTYCDPVYCGVDEYVHTNNCTACDPGMTRPGGDDASGADTY
jgi:hypothetical protein